jgi:hypothetical protein
MIRVVHPGSGSYFFICPGSRIQGSKRHWITDPESATLHTSYAETAQENNVGVLNVIS